jgi:hypothetical protein
MEIISLLLIVFGLCIFEIVNSVDNVVVDSEVLKTVKRSSRRIFLFWDMVFAVLIVRGLLPWFLVFATVPQLGLIGSFTASFSSDPIVLDSINSKVPFLLVGAGTFFVLLFFDWLFRKPKNFSHVFERFFHGKDEFFHSCSIAFIISISFLCVLYNFALLLPVFIGSTIFFLIHGLKDKFHEHRYSIVKGKHKNLSDFNKLVYLEIIDAVFSVDSVLGAFAFTVSVPIIIIGAGLGALIIRLIAVRNVEHIKKYAYLRNGAMYSIFVLGILMIIESFGFELPFWLSTLSTFIIIIYFFIKSHREMNLVNDVLKIEKAIIK